MSNSMTLHYSERYALLENFVRHGCSLEEGYSRVSSFELTAGVPAFKDLLGLSAEGELPDCDNVADLPAARIRDAFKQLGLATGKAGCLPTCTLCKEIEGDSDNSDSDTVADELDLSSLRIGALDDVESGYCWLAFFREAHHEILRSTRSPIIPFSEIFEISRVYPIRDLPVKMTNIQGDLWHAAISASYKKTATNKTPASWLLNYVQQTGSFADGRDPVVGAAVIPAAMARVAGPVVTASLKAPFRQAASKAASAAAKASVAVDAAKLVRDVFDVTGGSSGSSKKKAARMNEGQRGSTKARGKNAGSVTQFSREERDGVLIQKNREYSATVFPGSETIGPIVAHQDKTDYLYFALKPDLLPQLNYASKLWQEWRFKKLRVTYVGMQGDTTVGLIALVPQYKPPMAALNIQGFDGVTAAAGTVFGPVRENEGLIAIDYDTRRLTNDGWRFTTQLGTLVFGPDDYAGGLLVVYDSVNLTNHTGDLMIGSLRFDYTVEFRYRDAFFGPEIFLKTSDFVDPGVAHQVKEEAGVLPGGQPGHPASLVASTVKGLRSDPTPFEALQKSQSDAAVAKLSEFIASPAFLAAVAGIVRGTGGSKSEAPLPDAAAADLVKRVG